MANVTTLELVTDLAAPPDPTQSYFARNMLRNAKIPLHYERWGDSEYIPGAEGRNIILRRWAHLPVAGQLQQGIAPTGQTPTLDDFTVALVQFGDFIALTDMARWTQKDPVLNKFTELLGLQAGYTYDTYIRDIVANGTNVNFSNGAARTDVFTIPDGNDLDRMIRTLAINGAEYHLGGNDGTTMANTYPISPAYACVIHPRTWFTLQNISGCKDRAQYNGAAEGEIGRYKELAFFRATDPSNLGVGAPSTAAGGGTSAVVTNTGGTVDVYHSVAFGKHAYHRVHLSGKNTSYHAKPLGSGGTADPLDQIGTNGWKTTGACLITNQNWMVRLEHAVEL